MPRKAMIAESLFPIGVVGPLRVDRITRNTTDVRWSLTIGADWPILPDLLLLRARVSWDSGHYGEWVYGSNGLTLPGGLRRTDISERISVPFSDEGSRRIVRSRVTSAEFFVEFFMPLTTEITVEVVDAAG